MCIFWCVLKKKKSSERKIKSYKLEGEGGELLISVSSSRSGDDGEVCVSFWSLTKVEKEDVVSEGKMITYHDHA